MRFLALLLLMACSSPIESVATRLPKQLDQRPQPVQPIARPEPPTEVIETIPATAAVRRRYRGVPLLPLPQPTDANTAVFLARLYFIEVEGPRAADLAIMAHVLDDRRTALARRWDRHVSLLETIDLYSGGRLRLPPHRRPDRYKWILALHPGITEPPDGFPAGRSWERTAASWTETLSAARQHVAGELPPDPCRGRAGYWGGRGELAQTTDAPRGTMRAIVCHPDQILRTYSTARTRRRQRDT